MMRRVAVCLVLFALVGCSKTVVREGSRFSQTEPGSSPTPDPTPDPTSTSSPTPIGCEPDRLGALGDFGLLAKADAKLEGVRVGGRVAATDAGMADVLIGEPLPLSASRIDLAAAQTMTLNTVRIPHGRVTYGKSLEKNHSSAHGGFAKAPFDLGPLFADVALFAKACGNLEANTVLTRECREVGASPIKCTLTIRGDQSLNIAEVKASQLLDVNLIVVDLPKGSSLVTNLPENRIAIFRKVSVKFSARMAENPGPTQIFWNFTAADSLEFTDTKFRGVVIAPDARTVVNRQIGQAGFWTRELTGSDSNW